MVRVKEQQTEWKDTHPAILLSLLPRLATLTDTDNNVQAVVAGVEALSVALRAVTDERKSVVLEILLELRERPVWRGRGKGEKPRSAIVPVECPCTAPCSTSLVTTRVINTSTSAATNRPLDRFQSREKMPPPVSTPKEARHPITLAAPRLCSAACPHLSMQMVHAAMLSPANRDLAAKFPRRAPNKATRVDSGVTRTHRRARTRPPWCRQSRGS